MKVVLQAIIGSISIHIIYVVVMMLVGYIKNYKPDFENAWGKVGNLQNEVEFVSYAPSFLCFIIFRRFSNMWNCNFIV